MANLLNNLVREAGLEPARLLKHRILSPGRLPIPPLPPFAIVDSRSTINEAYQRCWLLGREGISGSNDCQWPKLKNRRQLQNQERVE